MSNENQSQNKELTGPRETGPRETGPSETGPSETGPSETGPSETVETIENWDDLPDIKSLLLRGIYAHGFEAPSPIQKKAIVPMFEGKDIIAQAQSGTGKTGCFTIGTLQRINTDEDFTQAMILSPTRELSFQTKKVFDAIGSMIPNVRSHLLIGGTSTQEDIEVMSKSVPHVVIGCTGRVQDMLRRKHLKIDKLKIIVVDEADEMFSHGFKEQIYSIFQYLPNEVQVALFSATMPHELNVLTEKFMRTPVKILVKAESLTLEGIAQYYVALDSDDHKYEALKDLYSTFSVSQCIIYCNTVKRVQDLYEAMTQDDFPVCRIHSNMDKNERHANYTDFTSGKMRVLISSNVTARGIDVQQVSTVINFDIPKDVHSYLHRIGRSGRWGRKGMGINFVTKYDTNTLREIETYYHTEISELPASVAEN